MLIMPALYVYCAFHTLLTLSFQFCPVFLVFSLVEKGGFQLYVHRQVQGNILHFDPAFVFCQLDDVICSHFIVCSCLALPRFKQWEVMVTVTVISKTSFNFRMLNSHI